LRKQKIYLTGYDLIEIFGSDASKSLNWLFTAIATGKDPNDDTYSFSDGENFLRDLQANYNLDTGENIDQFYNDIKLDLARLQNFSTKMVLGAAGEDQTGGNATFVVAMKPEDKLAMIPRVMEQHRLNLQENSNLTWQDYTSFYIAPGSAEIKVNLLKTTTTNAEGAEQEAYASYYSYPDNPNDPATQNVIYGNQDDETQWSDTSAFEAEMKRRIDAIINNGGEIYRIEYNAGARSSAVGTMKYGGTDNASKTKGGTSRIIEGVEYKNGELPKEKLRFINNWKQYVGAISSDNGWIRLYPPASRSLDKLLLAAEANTENGKPAPIKFKINAGFRTYEDQVEVKKRYGADAATPGTSNHGFGLAVDFAYGSGAKLTPSTKHYKWLQTNAATYGFKRLPYNPKHPESWEAWHWEYQI
jgi:hypothetical protein